MNEIDELTRFRDAVPVSVTPRAEQLFRAGLREEPFPSRRMVLRPRPRKRLTRIPLPWRLGLAVGTAAALAAGILVAVLPSAAPPVLTARLLADRASAAALARPAVNPGQWVYRLIETGLPPGTKGGLRTSIQPSWETADGEVGYGPINFSVYPFDDLPSYSQLGSLPTSPAALDAYLASLVPPGESPAPKGVEAFSAINGMLDSYVLPPRLQAELYQALAVIPGIQVDSHVTAIDGQAGVAFKMQLRGEIILNASNYTFLGEALGPGSAETDVVRMAVVGAPGSTRPSHTPPTAVELLAEHADRAVSLYTASDQPPYTLPGTWVMRKLVTSSGAQTVWATADDLEQASYVNGRLQVCSRSAACARSTQWLMPAGPSYAAVNAPPAASGGLPESLSGLRTALNAYQTGCTDSAGDCNAVSALANLTFGYLNLAGPNGDWFLLLASIPGVTVQHVTDVTGQADIAFRFPFTDGTTEILLNARTYRLAGYVRDGAETLITNAVTVSGPGSRRQVAVKPKPGSATVAPHGGVITG